MKNWKQQFLPIRKKEIEIILSNISKKPELVLELGAGEGLQSEILSHHCNFLICTEYNIKRLEIFNKNNKKIKYISCDAENLCFKNKTFDMIYSSNLLEHLKNPHQALIEMRRCLKEDGIMIHVIPNHYMKMLHILLFYPQMFLRLLTKLLKINKTKIKSFNNNVKSENKEKFINKIFLSPHGESKNNLEELIKFKTTSWLNLFKQNNLKVFKKIDLIFYSPYGFGFKTIRKIMEKIGFSVSYAYIMKRR